MNNTAYNVDFTRLLSEPLKNDETMLSLGKSISEELQKTIRLSILTILYPRIDELDESILDILARDFHVDWYDDTYPIEAKRSVIKSSVNVHKRLGTKYAVVRAVGDIFPNSEVEEWFEYGGTHHHFRIILDLTNAKAPVSLAQIVRAAKFYKRLSAHLDSVIYQMSAVIEIHTGTEYFRFSAGRTNQYNAGTRPRRNVKGGISNADINISQETTASKYKSTYTGTEPKRAVILSLNAAGISAETDTAAYKNKAGMTGQYSAGESPHRYTIGNTLDGIIEAATQADNYSFSSEQSGKKPVRNIKWNDFDEDVQISPLSDNFRFNSPQSGNIPRRNIELSTNESELNAQTGTENYLYSVSLAGTSSAGVTPYINTQFNAEKGGVIPTIQAEAFVYKTKRCGTERCKN